MSIGSVISTVTQVLQIVEAVKPYFPAAKDALESVLDIAKGKKKLQDIARDAVDALAVEVALRPIWEAEAANKQMEIEMLQNDAEAQTLLKKLTLMNADDFADILRDADSSPETNLFRAMEGTLNGEAEGQAWKSFAEEILSSVEVYAKTDGLVL